MPAPAAGQNYYAGSAGRVQLYLVTPDLSVGPPTVPASPTRVAANGMKKWGLTVTTQSAKILHFECPGDSYGNIFPTQLQGGIGDWTAEFEGYYDADSAGSTGVKLHDGAFIVFDLIFSKTSGYGFYGLVGKVTSFRITDEFGSEPTGFACTVEAHGAPPEPGFP